VFDELDRLRADEDLRRLLSHYASACARDREAWQDRLMSLDGVSPPELVRLHGELLAFEWIQQRTGIVGVLRPGAVPQCYRLTAAGAKALKRVAGCGDKEMDEVRAA
jgi:hypothetical protein